MSPGPLAFLHRPRARRLRTSAEDLACRLPGFTPILRRRVTASICATMETLGEIYGPPDQLPGRVSRSIGRSLQTFASGRYHWDVGGSHGIWIVGAYVEATGLCGADARLTEDLCRAVIAHARRAGADLVASGAETAERPWVANIVDIRTAGPA